MTSKCDCDMGFEFQLQLAVYICSAAGVPSDVHGYGTICTTTMSWCRVTTLAVMWRSHGWDRGLRSSRSCKKE